MKPFLRGITYSYIAVYLAKVLLGALSIEDSKLFWVFILSVTLLNIFSKPLLNLVSMPSKGIIFWLISIFLTALLLNILVAIIPDFNLKPVELPDLLIIGFLIPSTYLSSFWAGILSAIMISLVSNYLYWLNSKK